jgi:hypothetical protein
MAALRFQIGDIVRGLHVYGDFNTGRVCRLPADDDSLYRVEVGDVPDGDGGVDVGCFFEAEGEQLELVVAAEMDVAGPEAVEVEVRADGTVIWVNVDGICRFRACRVGRLTVTDHRSTTNREEHG